MVHGATGHSGAGDDLLSPDSSESLLGEQGPAGVNQRLAGGGPALGLGAARCDFCLLDRPALL